MRRIILAPSFDAEFLDILNYIEDRFGERVADEYEARFKSTVHNLAHAPLIGTQEHGYPTTLFAIVLYPNWLFYRFTDDELRILHIRDSRRNKGSQTFSK